MTTLRYALRHPIGVLVYVLVYWGRTLFWLLFVASNVLWFVGGPTKLSLALGAAGVGVASFNLGLLFGEAGLPAGKRR